MEHSGHGEGNYSGRILAKDDTYKVVHHQFKLVIIGLKLQVVYYNTFGVRTDGTLWSWGNNFMDH